MSDRTWCALVAANAARFGELVAGIDPHLPDIPAAFEAGTDSWIARYVDVVLDTLEGQVGFVKFQSAYFEACGLAGLTALSAAIKRAKAAGMGVILDAKRGDIGATAAAYARAYLTPQAAGGSGDFEADCLTVNPLLGPDTLEPFTDCVRRYGKGIFVLCRTSNPSAGWLQDRITGNRSIADRLAELITTLGTPDPTAPGLSPIGAVIGATAPQEASRLRRLLPNAIILAPGLGAQGGDATIVRLLRGDTVGDLLVPVSRGLTRVDDRTLSIKAYGQLLLDRVVAFRAIVARGDDEALRVG